MKGVIIGVDPHKASHTAVAIDGTEAELEALGGGVRERVGLAVVPATR